ncbi:LacI family DNA-binding transcriptional regulator [Spirosoma montaniterrae]|uniref:HTH lacI-type domain-containing protein n=1 Tax=Spirosoma montaniterrae TaxID=1178516 RepID=A0A1P9WZ07_9BACT|nr:LacI family DNA-binding transcriptional regulator [Spirosoma montaniterrae]AQG80612.1 hypothetical protein AWR27_15545 [Spirosoma montaniterrae]
MTKPVTLKELSQELGVSVATVSKALNHDPTIGHYTRERVLKLAQDRNYIPNENARNFQQQKSLTIGLLIPNVLDQFFVQAINGVDAVAVDTHYSLVVAQTRDDPNRAAAVLNMMLRDRVDGLIATITPNTTDLAPYQRLEAAGIPVVYMARSPNDPACHRVVCQNVQGATQATRFLLERGHRRLAHLKGPDAISASHQRQTGFANAIADWPERPRSVQVETVDLLAESVYKAMQRLMERPDYPTGILTFKTYITLDAIDFLRQHYPERLARIDFVGFGNLPLIRYLDPKPAASVEENAHLMGQETMRLLLRLMQNAETGVVTNPQHIEVPCKLIPHEPQS